MTMKTNQSLHSVQRDTRYSSGTKISPPNQAVTDGVIYSFCDHFFPPQSRKDKANETGYQVPGTSVVLLLGFVFVTCVLL